MPRQRRIQNSLLSKISVWNNNTVYCSGRSLSSSDFESILQLHLSGYTQGQILRIKGFSPFTITKYLKMYKNGTHLANTARKEPRQQQKELFVIIEQITRQNPHYTLLNIQQEIHPIAGTSMSLSTLSKIRKHELNFSMQKIDKPNIQRTTDRIQSRKQQFKEMLNASEKKFIVCVDETHFEFHSTQRKYRCFHRHE